MNALRSLRSAITTFLLAAIAAGGSVAALAQTVTPVTWNIIGLDSNKVADGPDTFPVGVRVCATSGALTGAKARFNWVTVTGSPFPRSNYITLTSPTDVDVPSLASGACADVFHWVTVTRNAAAYNPQPTAKGYQIDIVSASGTVSTPANRELVVEQLISQNRNAVSGIQVGPSGGPLVNVPLGGTTTMVVGQTYDIKLLGSTATGGYEQLEAYLTLSPANFRINSIASTYTADAGNDPLAPIELYADGCRWINGTDLLGYGKANT